MPTIGGPKNFPRETSCRTSVQMLTVPLKHLKSADYSYSKKHSGHLFRSRAQKKNTHFLREVSLEMRKTGILSRTGN